MVKKVIGRSNELEFVFIKDEGDSWKTVIPRNLSGQYYLDLYAIDGAGNESYMAKALFEVDPFSLCYKFTLLEDYVKFEEYSESDYEVICKEVRCI